MSKEVDQKIVEMQFNNSDFEQKIAQSLVTLQKLKEATKLEDAGKGLENLSKGAGKVDLTPVTDGLDQINDHFSAMGIFGMNIFQKLSDAALNFGNQVVQAITAAPKEGWSEFELNTDSIKTILNSAKDDQGLPVTLDAVNEKLNELNAYSDKTIYSFSDMTSNIGKFTNAGVSLDKSVSAIQGVANVAALAGANSNQASAAMYNFAQALSSGAVRLQDWKSIENANMATVDFKKNLIQTALDLGTLREEEGKYISTTTDMQGKVSDAFDVTTGFNDSLSAQWMTADVLVKTLGLYTDETTDLGKAAYKAATEVTTFSKLIDTLKEAMGSGWMQTWQTIVGDYEESLALWTGVNNVLSGIISKSAEARNNMLAQWKEAGGRDDLIAGLGNLWKIVSNIARPISDAWHMIFPSINATGLVSLTKGFREFTEKLVPTREVMNSLRITFKGLFTLLGIGINTIKTIAGIVLPILGKAIGAVGSVVGFLAGGFLKWVATMTSAVQEGSGLRVILEKLLIPFKILGAAIFTVRDVIVTAFGVTKDSIKNAKGMLGQFVDTLKQIGDKIGPVVIFAVTSMANAITNLGNKLAKVIRAFKSSNAGKDITKRIESIKTSFAALPRVISAFYKELQTGKNPLEIFNSEYFKHVMLSSGFYNIIAMLKQDGKTFSEAIKTFFTSLKDGTLLHKLVDKFGKGFDILVAKLKNVKIIGPLIEKLSDFFKKFKGVSDGAGVTVTSFLHNVVDKLKGIDFMKIGIIGLVSSLALFYFRWSKVGKNASTALKALSKFIMNGGKIAQTAVDKYNGFLKIAVAIGIIAGSIWLLSKVPADRFREVCIALAAAFAAMFAAIMILSVMKIPEDKMKAIGIAFAGLGGGFLAVAVAAKIISGMDWPELAKAGVALVAFVGMVVAAAKIAGKVGTGTGLAFVGLGAALLLLIPSIVILSKLDTHTLIKGGAAVFAFMLMIAKAAKTAGEAKGALGAFLGISIALLLLIPSIKILGNMDTKQLLKGGAAVAALMLMLAEAAKRANGGAKGFTGMAIAIAVITGAMYVLSGLPWTSLFTTSHALAIVLKTVSDALAKMAGLKFTAILKAVVGMAAAIAVVGGALYLMTTYIKDSNAALKNALGVAAILAAFSIMGPAITALSKIDFISGVQAAGNAMVFFGAMVLCLGALGKISQLGNGEVGNAIADGASMVGRVIHNFLESLFTGQDADSGKLINLGDHLSTFAESIGGFLSSVSGVSAETVDNAKNLALAILAICGADLLDALTGWLRGSHDLGSFADSMAQLGTGVAALNDALVGKELDSAKIKMVADIVTAFTDVANALPRSGGLLQDLIGFKDLGDFANDMKEFMDGGFRGFLSSINMLGDLINFGLITKMLVVKDATMAMVDIANALPSSGVISTFIDGEKDLGKFATNMANFMGAGFNLFVLRVNTVQEVDLGKLRGNIIPATQEMINLASKIKTNTGIISFIFGQKDLGKFGSTLADFGAGIVAFNNSISGVSFTNISGMTYAMERLATLNDSAAIKNDNLSTFGGYLSEMGYKVNEFASYTEGVTPEFLSQMVDGLTNLHNLMIILAATDYSGVSNFTDTLAMLASTAVTSFIDEFSLHIEAAKNAVVDFVNAASEGLSINKEAYTNAARASVTAYTTEFIAPNAGLLVRACGEHMISSLVEGINSKLEEIGAAARASAVAYTTEFIAPGSGLLIKACGEHMVTSLLDGVDTLMEEINKKGIASATQYSFGLRDYVHSTLPLWASGGQMVKAAISGINDQIYRFYELGQDSVDGYKEGIRSKASEVADETYDMVTDAIEAARRAQDSASPSKKYRKLAYDAVSGYILGFKDNVGAVEKTVSDTGYAGIQAMQDTINAIGTMLDDNLDYQPTVTPVIDLTQLMNGVGNANRLLADVQLNGIAAAAAFSIANEHNEALAQNQKNSAVSYSGELSELIENTKNIITAVKKNRYAIIDGDEAFSYFDRRMGMA